MPMINIAFIIRLDPERIIVAPMASPPRNFVVELSGNLVARRRRLRAERMAENSGSQSEIFPHPGEGSRMLGLPENVRSTLRTLSAFKEVADRLGLPLPAVRRSRHTTV